MLAHNQYEQAFQHWLRDWKIPHVAVHEQHRAWAGDISLKSFDFLISHPVCHLLVDIKGRHSNRTVRKSNAENWVTQDDLDSLGQWQHSFGDHFQPLLVFAYRQPSPHLRLSCSQVAYDDHFYSFYGIALADYQAALKPRSQRWQTLSLPRDQFRRLRRPIASFLPRDLFLTAPSSASL